MVVLTIIADSNDHTVRFREPLGKSNYARLLSFCHALSIVHGITEEKRENIFISDRQNNVSVEIIPPGKYILESLAKALWKILREDKGYEVRMNDSVAATVIVNPYQKKS